MASSSFIKAMHPKAAILPEPGAIQRILNAGWVGQLKIDGHRAQLHVPANDKEPILAYTRQGKFHAKDLPPKIVEELRRIFRPAKGFTALDAEWLKPADKIFVFDILKKDGEVLRGLTFPERWKLLPREFISPFVSILPLIRDLPACLKALETAGPNTEGLVFKSTTSPGFGDTSIVRCRKRPS